MPGAGRTGGATWKQLIGFLDRPILNSPYDHPTQHWELDNSGQPTNQIMDRRRDVAFITPIPATKKGKSAKASITSATK